MANAFESKVAEQQSQIAGEIAARVKSVCFEYADRIPLALAVGALQIAAIELINEASQ